MMAALNGTWLPKEGDKCDVKPKALGDNSYFLPGIVEKVVSGSKT